MAKSSAYLCPALHNAIAAVATERVMEATLIVARSARYYVTLPDSQTTRVSDSWWIRARDREDPVLCDRMRADVLDWSLGYADPIGLTHT